MITHVRSSIYEHVGRHKTAIHAKVSQEIPIRNPFLDDKVKSKGKRKISKSVSLFL